MPDICSRGDHRPDCRLVDSSVISTGYSWSTGEPHKHHECTRCDGCGALPSEMCHCGMPDTFIADDIAAARTADAAGMEPR